MSVGDKCHKKFENTNVNISKGDHSDTKMLVCTNIYIVWYNKKFPLSIKGVKLGSKIQKNCMVFTK